MRSSPSVVGRSWPGISYWARLLTDIADRIVRTFLGQKRYWLVSAVGLVVLSATTAAVRLGVTDQIDGVLLAWIANHQSESAEVVFRSITPLTSWRSHAFFSLFAVVLFAGLGYRSRSAAITGAAVVSGFVMYTAMALMSHGAGQLRPYSETGALSFPSGHALSGFMVFGFATFLIWHYNQNRIVRVVWITVAVTGVLASGASRLYLLLHWPSDVFSAYFLGLLGLAIAASVYVAVEKSFSTTARRRLAWAQITRKFQLRGDMDV